MTSSPIIHISIFICLFLILPGCHKDSTSPSNTKNPNVIQPLALGNRWIYEIQLLDSAGTAILFHTDTITILRDTMINNEKWFRMDPGPWVTNRQNGYWATNGSSQYLVYPYPSDSGYSFVPSSGGTMSVLSTRDTLQIAAGKFVCYKYLFDAGSGKFRYLMAPNIGRVIEEQTTRTPNGFEYVCYRHTLISFVLN